MNRALRRQSAKRGITAKDLRQEGLSATRLAVDAYSVAVATVLRDKLGFGDKKLIMTMKQIEGLFDSINSGYVSIEDLKGVLRDEVGVEI